MNIIYKHENKVILHSFKNLLEINGIECFLKNEHSAAAAHSGISNFKAELLVLKPDDVIKAKSLIDDVNQDAPLEPAWTCGKCGEENEGNFAICWKYQSEYENMHNLNAPIDKDL